jgi:adenylosuccinate synthase
MAQGVVDVVLGLQRGDEGKGRIVDLLAENYDIVARFNGGPNAGHTILFKGSIPLKLHQLPSGVSRPGILNVIGNGTYVDPIRLLGEIAEIQSAGVTITPQNLIISDTAHLILPHHVKLDEIRESGRGGQGSTKSGIAYVAAEKYERENIRAELIRDGEAALNEVAIEQLNRIKPLSQQAGLPDFDAEELASNWAKQAMELAPFLADTVSLLHDKLRSGAKVLAEGAQAFGLDIEHGMYPFVTSSHTTVGGVLNGLGIGANYIDRVIGVAKATKSHVGGGPFVTEILDDKLAQQIRGQRGAVDAEFGATTGRERRLGQLDLPELRRAILVNGVNELALTKLDTVPRYGDKVEVAVAYKIGDKELSEAPSSARQLENCQPVYSAPLPTWTENISDIRKFADLPATARKYVELLSEQLNVPLTMLGVGPEREQIIFRD